MITGNGVEVGNGVGVGSGIAEKVKEIGVLVGTATFKKRVT